MENKRFIQLTKDLMTKGEEEWNSLLKEGEDEDYASTLAKYQECLGALNHLMDLCPNDPSKLEQLKKEVISHYGVDLDSVEELMDLLGNSNRMA